MKEKIIFILIINLLFNTVIYGHGRSDEMEHKLNSKPPAWLSLAQPIKLKPADKSADITDDFRPLRGDSESTRDRVKIPSRGIEIKVDYPISWFSGSSLSPDGTKLIINSGTTPHLYEISPAGKHREIPIQLPNITYDDGLKGFITGWSWASNDVLVGSSEIADERGHELIESRLYVFHLKEMALARIDISSLKIPNSNSIEIISVGSDLQHLKLRIGDEVMLVKADLKSAPKPLSASQPMTTHKDGTEDKNDFSGPPILWLVIGGILVVVLALFLMIIKRKKD